MFVGKIIDLSFTKTLFVVIIVLKFFNRAKKAKNSPVLITDNNPGI